MIHTFARISASRVAKHSTRLPTDLNLRVSRVSSPLTLSSTRSIVTKRYTEEHEWVELDSETSIATISITAHASSSLGDVVYVELPPKDKEISAGDQIGAVESVKAAADIYAPISGVVTEVNTQLGSEPSLLNKSPESKGWLCKIRATNPSELENLMSEQAYKAFCES